MPIFALRARAQRRQKSFPQLGLFALEGRPNCITASIFNFAQSELRRGPYRNIVASLSLDNRPLDTAVVSRSALPFFTTRQLAGEKTIRPRSLWFSAIRRWPIFPGRKNECEISPLWMEIPRGNPSENQSRNGDKSGDSVGQKCTKRRTAPTERTSITRG